MACVLFAKREIEIKRREKNTNKQEKLQTKRKRCDPLENGSVRSTYAKKKDEYYSNWQQQHRQSHICNGCPVSVSSYVRKSI